jgi:hypothetical protein
LVVGLNGILEVLDLSSSVELDDISELNFDLETSFAGDFVELVLKVLGVFGILVDTENGPLLEGDGLVDDGSEDAGVV